MPARRAAVCGKPIAHSLSPVIHRAGFEAAGLDGWTYDAVECTEESFPSFVAGLGPEWAGLSCTMPLKSVALAIASSSSPWASAVGAANTLVRQDDGSWFADNTDISGMVRVLRAAGVGDRPSIVIIGGGGTARAALGAAALLKSADVRLITRRPPTDLTLVAERLGLSLGSLPWESAGEAADADAVISTVPAGAADDLSIDWRPGTVVFDAIYDPWPTPYAMSALQRGNPVVSGLDLLLAQALGQFEQFTGVHPAPEEAMSAALLPQRSFHA